MKNKLPALIVVLLLSVLLVTACKPIMRDDNGFAYYREKDGSLSIVELPESETVIIPEEYNLTPVRRIGTTVQGPFYQEDYYPKSDIVKQLKFHGYVEGNFNFPNLETISFIDPLFSTEYLSLDPGVYEKPIIQFDFYGGRNIAIELLTEGKQVATNAYKNTIIELSKNVTKIEKGVFSGLEDARFKVAFQENEQPDGWEKGWNEGLPVDWGSVLYEKERDCANCKNISNDCYYFYVESENTSSDGLKRSERIFTVVGFQKGVTDAVMPSPSFRYSSDFEQILGYSGSEIYNTPQYALNGKGIKSLTVKMPTKICAVEEFNDLETIIYEDPVFIFSQIEGTVCRIEAPAGLDCRQIFLKQSKSNKEFFSDENNYYRNTEIKVFEIPRNITVIQSGAFENANPGTVLKVSFTEEEIPSGWEENWNSDLEVEYGVQFN